MSSAEKPSADDRQKAADAIVEPYTKSLGHLLLIWNTFHSYLTMLFLMVCDVQVVLGDDPDRDRQERRDLFLAIWNAIPNDRLQRHMLRKAATAKYTRLEKNMKKTGVVVDPIVRHERAILNEILWVVDTADTLGRGRDDSAHMPIAIVGTDPTPAFEALDWLDHPIAAQMTGRDVIAELELIRIRIETISRHTTQLWFYLSGSGPSDATLPKRPEWPTRPQSLERKAAPEPSQTPKQKRQRPASRE